MQIRPLDNVLGTLSGYNDQAVAADAGFDLPVVYLCWAVVLAILIPLSLWFSRVKERNPAWWLKYL